MIRNFEVVRTLGCLCDVCPLGSAGTESSTPVLPEIREDARLYVIGEAPGAEEVRQGSPFVGPSGALLWRVLDRLGVYRADCSVSNALLCRIPNEMRVYLRVLLARNRNRKKDGKPLWPSPVECCRPRVLRELESARAVLALGATAYASVTGRAVEESGLMAMRGYPHFLSADAAALNCTCGEEQDENCSLHREGAATSRAVEIAQFGCNG